MNSDGGHAVGSCFFDGHLGGPFRDYETKSPVAVDHGGAGSFLFYHKGCAWHYVALSMRPT